MIVLKNHKSVVTKTSSVQHRKGQISPEERICLLQHHVAQETQPELILFITDKSTTLSLDLKNHTINCFSSVGVTKHVVYYLEIQ